MILPLIIPNNSDSTLILPNNKTPTSKAHLFSSSAMAEAQDHKDGDLLVGEMVLLQGKLLKAREVFDVIHDPNLDTMMQVKSQQ